MVILQESIVNGFDSRLTMLFCIGLSKITITDVFEFLDIISMNYVGINHLQQENVICT